MHYNLLFNGCSFTHGSELEGFNNDCEYRDRHRYSHIISEKLGKTYANISISGNSNDRIVRETLEWFNAGNTCDLAIIQWTAVPRIEYISPYYRHPVNFNATQVVTKWKGTETGDLCKDIEKDHEETKIAHEHHYRYYYNDMLGVYNFYKNLYILEQFFEKNNINYYMIKLSSNIQLLKNKQSFLNKLSKFYWKTLCKHDWFDIPSIKGTIMEITDKRNYTPNYTHLGQNRLCGKHPSELGHQRIADFIINKIDNK